MQAKSKYHLQRGSKKYVCPSCGRRSLVAYVDDFDVRLSDDTGRCDRQDKCGYHLPPREWFAIHKNVSRLPPRPKHMPLKPIQKPDYIPGELAKITINPVYYRRNMLVNFLCELYGRLLTVDEIYATLQGYNLGTSNEFGGSPIFWQVDGKGRFRTGKIIGYNATTGKRKKNGGRALMKWAHTKISKDFNLCQCYFGAHLADRSKPIVFRRERVCHLMEHLYSGEVTVCRDAMQPYEPPLWLFESEKAVLIVALALRYLGFPLGIPIATGGCQGFNPSKEKMADFDDKHNILAGHQVTLFPDNGKYDEWLRRSEILKKYGCTVRVSDIMERPEDLPVKIELGDALDDVIIRCIYGSLPFSHVILSAM